jgi:hypothetical protein
MADFSFGITCTADMYALLLEEHGDYNRDRLSSKAAIRFAMTSWHLLEWAYNEFKSVLVPQYPKLSDYIKWAKAQCPQLAIMQDIANGSKHMQITKRPPVVDKAEVHHGAFSNAFSRVFDISSLDVHMKDGTKTSFEDLVDPVVHFWHNHLLQFGVAL